MRQVYYRAYAINAEGVAYGSTRYLEIDDNAYSPGWANASPLLGADGWWTSPWFGEFYVADDSGWLTHGELGWLFTMGERTNGIWIWREKLGWMWTNPSIYPFLYRNDSGSWLFFHGKANRLLIFYDYQTNHWMSVDLD